MINSVSGIRCGSGDEMGRLNVIERIPVVLPEREILFRLKYNIHKTGLDDETRRRIMSVINRGFLACRPRGAWTVLDISGLDDDTVSFENGVVISSRSLVEFLSGCISAVFMGVTVGAEITDMAVGAIRSGDASSALIYDAVGSETAEASIEWLNGYITREIRRSGMNPEPGRFSPGYGDLLLDNQKLFFELLQLGNFGVTLTDRYYFIPEKTVTAVTGIRKI